MTMSKMAAFAFAASIALCHAGAAQAAEGFEPRYNVAGTLGGEMFAPPDQSGWAAGIALTEIRINKVTGNDGQPLTGTIPGGAVPLPGPAPSALYPGYGASTARMDGTGTMSQANLVLGYLSTDRFGGGRLAFGFNLPYARKKQTMNVSAATPGLNWNPAVPAPTREAVADQFNAQYQDTLAAQAAGESGEVTGIGDAELLAGWLYVEDKVRILAGASLVLPTGKYNSAPGPDIGTGNFYTLRPAIQVAYLPTPKIGLAGKVTLGLNTRNTDNDLRSGNWIGLEAAAGYKTSVGVVGLHGVHVQQYQDDDNNPLGASRLRSTNAGAFFTTVIPGIDAAMTLQYMATTASRNAKHGDFTQVRVMKVF